MASWPAFALPLARAKNHRYRRRARDKCGSRFDTGFTLEITLVHRPIARARAACAPALRENKLDWGREGRRGREGGEGGKRGLVFSVRRIVFRRRRSANLEWAKMRGEGGRERERRGARLIFYLGGDLASRARILAFIDPDNHSPVSASSVLRSRERIRVAPGPLLLPPPPPSLLPPFAYLRLQLMLSRGKHPSETGMASSYSAESVSVGELARCATT